MRAILPPPGRPTLLVFTLGAGAECSHRHLLPARFSKVETAFHQACLDAALAAGRAAGCRLAVATDARLDLPSDVRRVCQDGATFGERFRHAMAQAEALSDGPLLVVGTDVPDLSVVHLREALDRLAGEPGRVVVGPSPDGGFYLLGAATPLAGILDGVRFCRYDTLRSLVSCLDHAGRQTVRLEPLVDLDSRTELERWLARETSASGLGHIAVWLRRALQALVRPPDSPRWAWAPPAYAGALGSRAPPR